MVLENAGQVTLGLIVVVASSYYIYDRLLRYDYLADVFVAVVILCAGLIYIFAHLGKKSGKYSLGVKEVTMGE